MVNESPCTGKGSKDFWISGPRDPGALGRIQLELFRERQDPEYPANSPSSWRTSHAPQSGPETAMIIAEFGAECKSATG